MRKSSIPDATIQNFIFCESRMITSVQKWIACVISRKSVVSI